jgi:hypothetical protein
MYRVAEVSQAAIQMPRIRTVLLRRWNGERRTSIQSAPRLAGTASRAQAHIHLASGERTRTVAVAEAVINATMSASTLLRSQ